jgi:hypothetical protein
VRSNRPDGTDLGHRRRKIEVDVVSRSQGDCCSMLPVESREVAAVLGKLRCRCAVSLRRQLARMFELNAEYKKASTRRLEEGIRSGQYFVVDSTLRGNDAGRRVNEHRLKHNRRCSVYVGDETKCGTY